MSITKTTEWEGERVRLVRLGGLKTHPNYPYNWRKSARYFDIPNRKIDGVICHATQGSNAEGLSAAIKLVNFAIANPRYQTDANGNTVYRKTRKGQRPIRIGGGRGWPGACYHILVPFRPEVVDGKFEVYRLWDDSMRIFHTGKGPNDNMVAIAWSGSMRTRHMPKFSDHGPHPTGMEAGTSLILNYLLPRYNLTESDLYGHFDFGKPTCPGDDLEDWIRAIRAGEEPPLPFEDRVTDELDMRPLDTWRERQLALIELGYDVGKSGADGIFGYNTRSAVEAVQDNERLVTDGVWGPKTEHAVRRLLALQ